MRPILKQVIWISLQAVTGSEGVDDCHDDVHAHGEDTGLDLYF